MTIFDSLSEYIITGGSGQDEALTGNIIHISTHHMHVLTRPTSISDEKYERNSLLFCVGFVLRREKDPRPFRPILSKLALTLRGTTVVCKVFFVRVCSLSLSTSASQLTPLISCTIFIFLCV